MDFEKNILDQLESLKYYRKQEAGMPFYMTSPYPISYTSEEDMMQDWEYIQQMYPTSAKNMQRKIIERLNYMDYEGSMIYDEYPDRWMLYKISSEILDDLKRENGTKDEYEGEIELMQILLFYEIYKKRHRRRKGFTKF